MFWSTSGNADHYLGHKPGTGFDKLFDSIKDLERSKNRNRSIDNEDRIYELERKLAKQKIQNLCLQKYPSDQKAYNKCKCGSYEKSNIGTKCKDGWRERNRKVSKKETDNGWRKCSYYALIKYGKNHCVEKKPRWK